MANLNIALIPGDGIGTEVVTEGVKVLNAALATTGTTVSTTEYDLGARLYNRTGETLAANNAPTCAPVTDPNSNSNDNTRSTARSAIRVCRRESLSAGCCWSCASASITTSTCAPSNSSPAL